MYILLTTVAHFCSFVVQVNGAVLNPPYNTDSYGTPKFKVIAGPRRMLVDVEDCKTFQVFFDGYRLVWARVSQSYSDHLTGMCNDCKYALTKFDATYIGNQHHIYLQAPLLTCTCTEPVLNQQISSFAQYD